MMYGAAAALAAFIMTALGMPALIKKLKSMQFGQTIYELGPKAHLNKQGTPNMGGILIATAAVVSALLFSFFQSQAWRLLPILLAALGSMAIGFRDDYIKNVRHNHEGLKPMQKVAGQVVVGLLFSVYCYLRFGGGVYLPFSSSVWDLGVFYIPLMTVLFIFMTNSANLQDGVDGILSSVSLIGGVAFGLIAFLLKAAYSGQAASTAIFALAGACAGFLICNHYPAKIMMGDTGSMFIGGMFCAVAMALGLQFWLIPICFTMMMSSLSVIIQRFYFKATHGKRIFKMSPIHHHFELSGMNEKQIVRMYSLVTLALSILAVLAALPLMR